MRADRLSVEGKRYGLNDEHRQVAQRDDGAHPTEAVDKEPAEVARLCGK
jgi:hypothetical protein